MNYGKKQSTRFPWEPKLPPEDDDAWVQIFVVGLLWVLAAVGILMHGVYFK